MQLHTDYRGAKSLLRLFGKARMLEFQALDGTMMHLHVDTNVVFGVQHEAERWGLRPHPVVSLWSSATHLRRLSEPMTNLEFIVSLPDIWDVQILITNCLDDAWCSQLLVHCRELRSQMFLEGLHVQANIRYRRADALDALGLYEVLRRRAQVSCYDMQIRGAQESRRVVQGSLSREFVCGSGHLQRARQRSFRDRVRCPMGVLGVEIAPLVPLIEDNVVSFVDPGALDAQLPQCANDHLGVLVACEVAAGTCNAPIEVALVVEDGASPRAAPHEVYSADARGLAVLGAVCPACGVEDAQIDLRPRVLVAPDDDAWPVHVEEEDRTVRGALSEDVVFDR
jgi:hypothetical protein